MSKLSSRASKPTYIKEEESSTMKSGVSESTILSHLCYYGGLYGAVYITCTIFIVPYIGFSVYFVCLITGQLLAALLIDLFGWLGSEKHTIHGGRVCGLMLTILGGILLLLANNEKRQISLLLMIILIFLSVFSGTLVPIQAATNNLLRLVRKWETMSVTGYSYITSSLILTLAAAVSVVNGPLIFVGKDNVWWHWLGGAIGTIYVAAGIKFSPIIGYATFYVAVIAGQLSLSLVSDAFGLLGPLKPSARSPMAICGVLAAALGAFLVSYFKAKQAPNAVTTAAITPSVEAVDDHVDDVEYFGATSGDEEL